MISKLVCWLWGHRYIASIFASAVVTDIRLYRDNQPSRLKPNTITDINLSLMPPGMKVSDTICFGPPEQVWVRLNFCLRCSQSRTEKIHSTARVGSELEPFTGAGVVLDANS